MSSFTIPCPPKPNQPVFQILAGLTCPSIITRIRACTHTSPNLDTCILNLVVSEFITGKTDEEDKIYGRRKYKAIHYVTMKRHESVGVHHYR